MIIKNKDNFNNIDSKSGLKEIPFEEIKILYENDSWDGALEGVCIWNQKKYYFLCFDQLDEMGENRWPRKYLLIILTEEQEKEEEREHQLFVSSTTPEDLKVFFENQKGFPSYNIEVDQIVGWYKSSR